MNELTDKIKEWLDTPREKRDIHAGATMLFRVNRNRILYNNVCRNLDRSHERIEYELKKIYNARIVNVNRQEVAALVKQVSAISAARHLDTHAKSDIQHGKRTDHDALPQEIQSLWEENLAIMRKMRECHLRLRLINHENSTCPDADRYPWAKEIISLDKQYRANFDKYDHYARQVSKDLAAESKTAARTINLMIAQYAKTNDAALADKIRSTYAKIASPTDKLNAKMSAAGLL